MIELIKNALNIYFRFIITFLLLAIGGEKIIAQDAEIGAQSKSTTLDSNYIKVFPEQLTSRIYLSRKFTDLQIEEQRDNRTLSYQPNSSVNLGVGATYNGFTLNLAYGFAFLNQGEEKGETNYLDLQSNIYGRKYAIDVFAQFYQGLYLNNTSSFNASFQAPYYLRPDMRVNMLGGSYFNVFNYRRFSYAATFIQNEYQKKSAGSFLLGGKVNLFNAIGDSSLVPNWPVDTIFQSFAGAVNMGGFQFGPGFGYAHTFVYNEHWFLTFSLKLNLMLGPVVYEIEGVGITQEWQLNSGVDFRFAFGYNSDKTYWGVSLIQDQSTIKSSDESIFANFGVGNARINYVKRFQLNDKWKKRLNKIPF